MPIYNNLFGVWKLLVYEDPVNTAFNAAYVVKSAKESVQQEVNPEFFVQGTALPLIQNIGGGTAELDISAPLLVKAHPWNISPVSFLRQNSGAMGDDLHDGFTLWCRLLGGATGLDTDFFNGLYSADPGFVIKNAGLEISTTGATYSIGFRGDTNFLGSENGLGKGWKVVDASDVNWNYWTTTPGIKPFPTNPLAPTELCPLRVATFYDIIASAQVAGMTLSGYVESLNIKLAVQTKQTNVVGQQTQRPIMGISGVDISFGGTLIWNTRQPLGYLFPWQSMNNGTPAATIPRVPTTPINYQSYGGTGKYSSFSLAVALRNGAANEGALPILPYLFVDKAIFSMSSLDVSNDFIRTTFEGKGWVSNPDFIQTGSGTIPSGSGVPM